MHTYIYIRDFLTLLLCQDRKVNSDSKWNEIASSSICVGIPNYVFRRTISLMTDAPFSIDMQPRSKLIETEDIVRDGKARNGWNSTTDHLLFRVSPWHPQFLLCAPTFLHSQRVPHRGGKDTSWWLSPSWQGIWRNLAETYACHREFLSVASWKGLYDLW